MIRTSQLLDSSVNNTSNTALVPAFLELDRSFLCDRRVRLCEEHLQF